MRAIRLCLVLLSVSISPGLLASINASLGDGGFSAVGAGQLKWWGMTVYDARLYASGGSYRPDQPHAIEITYNFSFSGEQLARSSLEEIERLFGRQSNREALLEVFESLFPDVGKGDRIIAVHHPGSHVEFYRDTTLLGRIEDRELAAMFFAIWLDPRTREHELRANLLGYPG